MHVCAKILVDDLGQCTRGFKFLVSSTLPPASIRRCVGVFMDLSRAFSPEIRCKLEYWVLTGRLSRSLSWKHCGAGVVCADSLLEHGKLPLCSSKFVSAPCRLALHACIGMELASAISAWSHLVCTIAWLGRYIALWPAIIRLQLPECWKLQSDCSSHVKSSSRWF